MTTMVQLTPDSISALSSAFGKYPTYYNGLIAAAGTSPYLAVMINAFVANKGIFQVPDGSSADTTSNGSALVINVGSSLLAPLTTKTGPDGVQSTTGGNRPWSLRHFLAMNSAMRYLMVV
ncbi:hypothetical protein NDK50_14820 [Paraburkholderia bryophila]|uniref:hypothetical protein n=1 Tax=Paraburkholderia bryophila TaxID=420952 RepID=UPI002349D4CC|nr:hypothetical protein [Paraburkholderia bryophila]WCM18707.1 hypothetical protein NDK50_14820 [Paraburkholderia bryophila]